MKIVMLTDDVRIDRRILQEADTLSRHGYEVVILPGWELGLPAHERLGSVSLLRFPSPPGPLSWFESLRARLRTHFEIHYPTLLSWFRTARDSLRRLQEQLRPPDPMYDPVTGHEQETVARVVALSPDVIHAHDLPLLRIATLAKRQLQVPVVYDAHELYPAIGTLTPNESRRLAERERSLLPECDRVITVNSLVAREMARRYDVPTPTVVENAVTAPPDLRCDRFREELGLSATDYIVLYQGCLALQRFLLQLVQAMVEVPPHVHLVIMGYGDAEAPLRRAVTDLSLQRQVHIKPAVSQTELPYWTASADVGVIPYQADFDLNTRYCSPNKLYEYVQAGLPMLANSALEYVSPIVEARGFGVTTPLRTPHDFATALTAMLSEGREGLNRYRDNLKASRADFGWEKQEQILLELYRELGNDTGRRVHRHPQQPDQ